MTAMNSKAGLCPKCGWNLISAEGYSEPVCTNSKCVNAPAEVDSADAPSLSAEERIKPWRGAPMHKIEFGSPTKGHVEISVPIHFTADERRALIDDIIDDLAYAKDYANRRGLDLSPARGGKNNE